MAADVATINVIWPACFVLESPPDAAVCPFAPAQFSVTPEGDGSCTYQWQFKGGPITTWTDLTEGANSSSGKFVLNSFGAVRNASPSLIQMCRSFLGTRGWECVRQKHGRGGDSVPSRGGHKRQTHRLPMGP